LITITISITLQTQRQKIKLVFLTDVAQKLRPISSTTLI